MLGLGRSSSSSETSAWSRSGRRHHVWPEQHHDQTRATCPIESLAQPFSTLPLSKAYTGCDMVMSHLMMPLPSAVRWSRSRGRFLRWKLYSSLERVRRMISTKTKTGHVLVILSFFTR